MPRHIARTLRKAMLASATAAVFAATTASAQAIEPILQGFSAPVGIHALGDADLLVSNWSGSTVERVGADGVRMVFLNGISSPAGIAVDATGAVFVSSYSSDNIIRVAPDGSREMVAEGLARPTGIAFALDTKSGERSVVARGLSLPVGVVEMPDGSIVSSQYGDLLVGTWGGGNIYRVAWPKSGGPRNVPFTKRRMHGQWPPAFPQPRMTVLATGRGASFSQISE